MPPKAPDAWNHSDERIRCDTARPRADYKSAQTLYASGVLWTYGLSGDALQEVYWSVVDSSLQLARLLYAASAWLVFTKAPDRQRINLLSDGAKRYGYCMPDLLTFEELCQTTDDQLFNKTVSNSNHVLHTVLPPPSMIYRSVTTSRVVHTRFHFPNTSLSCLTATS